MKQPNIQQDLRLLDALSLVRQKQAEQAPALAERLAELCHSHEMDATPDMIQEAVALYQAQERQELTTPAADALTPAPALPIKTSPSTTAWHPLTLRAPFQDPVAALRVKGRQGLLRRRLTLVVPLDPQTLPYFHMGNRWFDHLGNAHIRMRFDDEAPTLWPISERGYKRLVVHQAADFKSRLEKAQKLSVEVAFYGSMWESQVFVFPVAGFSFKIPARPFAPSWLDRLWRRKSL